MDGVDSFELMYREILLWVLCVQPAKVCDCYSLVRVHFLPRLTQSTRLGHPKAISETPGVDTMVLVANFSQSDTGCKRPVVGRTPTHIAATTLMTRLVLLGMEWRRRGAVVNISSGVCYRPSPSKAYLDNFSCTLHHEYGHQGIFVKSLVLFEGVPHGASAGGSLVPQSFGLVQSMPEWICVFQSCMLTISC
uniref:Uncharacterized protein n=1 Tax=Oncorhynchus kisutch TaxID=8019 RepID=A0A8C7F9M3_ONCKI